MIIAAILSHAYKDEFSTGRYTEISEPGKKRPSRRERANDYSPDQEGITRLFIALGKKDGITSQKLVDLIRQEAMVAPNHIRNVEIYDNFSFANVPFQEAELIIRVFRKKGRNRKPLILEAKDKTESEDRKPRTNAKRRKKRK
jgi:ATP-dependent RNA helicase DeaD